MDEAQKASPGVTAPIIGALTPGCDWPPSVDRPEKSITDNSRWVISKVAASNVVDPVAVKGVISLVVPEEGAIAPAGSNFLPPVTFPPLLEAEPDGSRPRSSLRDGTALDGLVPSRPLLNSLLDRSDLRPVDPPVDPSTDFNRCRGFLRKLEKAKEAVAQCDTLELAAVARGGIAPLHQPKVKEISDRKHAYHIPDDPIDPVVVFVKAIPLVHRVLHQDASGKPGLDLDGVAYIVERLGEAECLRAHQQDIRFDVLQALSAFLGAIINKADEECWACVEAA